MNDTQFIEKYCHNCGTQRCEGIGTEWFEGCPYRWNHDSYDAATEIKKLNEKIMELANKLIKATNEKLPAADLVPIVHGEWIYDKTYYEADECHCSLCNQLMTTAKGVRMNYCPNCGAKMVGGK